MPQERDKVCRNIGRIMRLLLVVNLATEQQSQSNNALIRCYLFAFWFLLSNLERTNENIGSLEVFRGRGVGHMQKFGPLGTLLVCSAGAAV